MDGAAILFGLTVMALLTFGLVMLASTSSVYAAYVHGGDAFFFFKRQTLWMVLGVAACAVTARLDYHCYRRCAWVLFIVAVLLLAGVLLLGKPINGATRWFVFGPIRFQPSEFAKYVLVIVLAAWFEKMRRTSRGQLRPRIEHWWWGVLAPLAIMGILAALILKGPDLGTALLLGMVAMALMWLAGSPVRWLAAIMGVAGMGIGAFLVAIFQFGMFHGSYQVRRILDWWHWEDLSGGNYQQHMAKLAFGLGSVEGSGLGNSRMKLGYLPEAHTDFILPIIGEELGLIGSLSVVAGFCVLIVCGMVMVSRAPDVFGVLLGYGIVVLIGLQALINIAVVTSMVPNKGLPLPLISYGGSSLTMTLAGVGVMFNIFRQAHARVASSGGRA